MDKNQQQDVFKTELDTLVWKMSQELDLTTSEVVGILQMKQIELTIKANEKREEK